MRLVWPIVGLAILATILAMTAMHVSGHVTDFLRSVGGVMAGVL